MSYRQIILLVFLFSVLWFLPEIFGVHSSALFPITLLRFIPLFSVSALCAHIVQFVMVIIFVSMILHFARVRNFLPIKSTVFICVSGLLLSLVTPFQYLTNTSFALLFLLLSVSYFIRIVQENDVPKAVFCIVVLNLCGAVFEPIIFLFCLLMLLIISFYNMLSIKSLCAGLWAFVLVGFIGVSIFYLTDQMPLLNHIWQYLISYEWQMDKFQASFLSYSPLEIIYWVVLLVLLILVVLFNIGFVQNLKAQMRFYFLLVSILFFVSLIVSICFFNYFFDLLLIPCFLLLIQFSLFFSYQQKRLGNILFVSFVVLCIAYRILSLIGL